jgi:hypothetical protein
MYIGLKIEKYIKTKKAKIEKSIFFGVINIDKMTCF